MDLPTEVRSKISDGVRSVVEGAASDDDAAEEIALYVQRTYPIVARGVLVHCFRKQIRQQIRIDQRAAAGHEHGSALPIADGEVESKLRRMLFPELLPRLEVAPGILRHQSVMTGPDWDGALAIYRNRRDQAEIAFRHLERRYQQIRPLLKGELTTADVADQLLHAPLDDEPYTEEERAEDAAALERIGRGEGTPL